MKRKEESRNPRCSVCNSVVSGAWLVVGPAVFCGAKCADTRMGPPKDPSDEDFKELKDAVMEGDVDVMDLWRWTERHIRPRSNETGLRIFHDIQLKGWNCRSCRRFNSEEKETQMMCVSCNAERPS